MKITSTQNLSKYNYSIAKQDVSPKASVSFQSKMVNKHIYTDREYVDAMKYKYRGRAYCSDFFERYSVWSYFFTNKPDKHTAEVNKCIKDIKEVEKREAAARAEMLKKLEEEKQRNEKELLKIQTEEENRQNIIDSYTKLHKTHGLGACDLSEKIQETISDDFLQPLGESIADKTRFTTLPNAVLVSGNDFQQNEKVVKALATQILKDKTPQNFTEIRYENNPEIFQSTLTKAKLEASQKYKENSDISVIYIPDFDKIALKPNNPEYDASLNSFLKVFLLDCAKNGVFVFATAKDENKIESPFLINNKRFGVSINLNDEE